MFTEKCEFDWCKPRRNAQSNVRDDTLIQNGISYQWRYSKMTKVLFQIPREEIDIIAYQERESFDLSNFALLSKEVQDNEIKV